MSFLNLCNLLKGHTLSNMEAAGTAVGIASLGIQVCQGLISYYHDWQSYHEDISAACDKVSSLERTFALLKETLGQASLNAGQTAQVRDSLLSCTDSIRGLEKRCAKLQASSQPTNFRERAAAVTDLCRLSSDEYIGRPIDEPNMQHVVRRIANVNCNVEEDEEHCFRVMERDVQTPFKPMYEVYMRHLLKASTQTKDICMHVVCSRCNQNDHVLQDQYVQFPGCSSINSGLSHVTSVRCRLQDVPER